jgi:hypothetical protein
MLQNLATDNFLRLAKQFISAAPAVSATVALTRLSEADDLIGHNCADFDLPLLLRLHGWAPKPGCKIVDTLIASRLILANIGDLDDQSAAMGDPKLGKLRGRHSLEAWGARLGVKATWFARQYLETTKVMVVPMAIFHWRSALVCAHCFFH